MSGKWLESGQPSEDVIMVAGAGALSQSEETERGYGDVPGIH